MFKLILFLKTIVGKIIKRFSNFIKSQRTNMCFKLRFKQKMLAPPLHAEAIGSIVEL